MDGIIVIDKPGGPSSAAIVRQIKARLGNRVRVGHLGTLDPFATGVLPVLVGEGTKLATFIQEGTKQYEGTIALGSETDTLDVTGAVIRTAPAPPLDELRLARLAAQFVGRIEQTPPVFSAIKRGGIPLYKLARRGAPVDAPSPREVHIEALELRLEATDRIGFNLVCSAGTYVRSLARDIGLALETAAHLAALRRVRNGDFRITDAHRLDEVLSNLERHQQVELISLRQALAQLPEVEVERITAARLRHGDARCLDHLGPPGGDLFKLIWQDQLVAVARMTSRTTAAIARVFGTGEE